MKRICARLLIITALFLPASGLFSQGVEDPFLMLNSRLAALGGYHTAFTEDYMTLFTNPAGTRSVPFDFLASEISIRLKGPIFDITNAMVRISGGADPLNDPALNAMLTNLNTGLNLTGPVSLAFVSNGLGLGLFNWDEIELRTLGMNISTLYRDNLVLAGGYSFRLPLPPDAGNLDMGFQLKGLARGTASGTHLLLSFLADLFANPQSFILNDPFMLSLGGGLDAGIMYSVGGVFTIGVTGRDLFSATYQMKYPSLNGFFAGTAPVTGMGLVPTDLSAGIKVTPPLGIIGRVINKIDIYLDYLDILDFVTHPSTSRNWLLHLDSGMEISLLEILHLRAGFGQGLFSGGLGLDLTFLKLSAAMYGTEESRFPSLNPVYNVLVSFEFDY
jgi:hypothetical protein